MDIYPSQAYQALFEGIQKNVYAGFDAILAVKERRYETERLAQYSTGVATLERAFQSYNREISKKTWMKTQEAGAVLTQTFGQIDETILGQDHDELLEKQRRYIEDNISNGKAKEQLLIALEQKGVANYGQVTNLWETYRQHEMVMQSDRNIQGIMEGTESAQKKKDRIKDQLFMDVRAGYRYAADAGLYEVRLTDQVDAGAALAGALLAAKNAGYDPAVADTWIDQNTPFWSDTPEKREALKGVVHQEINRQRQEIELANERHDNEQDAVLAKWQRDFYDDPVKLQDGIDRGIPNAHFTDAQYDRMWFDRLTERIKYLNNPPDVDDSFIKMAQARNEDILLTQLVQARADGVQPTVLRKMIDDANIVRDEKGNVVNYRISGKALQGFYKDFVDPTSSVAFKDAADWITAFAKEKKLSPTATEDLTTRFWALYAEHPRATEDEMRKAAEALANPIVKQDLEKLYNKAAMQGLFGDATILTSAEKALLDVQERGFTWRSREPENLNYLQRLAAKWLEVAQTRFPVEGLTRAEPDLNGWYGYEGIPLFYNEKGDLYRYVIEGKQAVLQRLATTREGRKVWELVTAPQAPPATTSPGPQAIGPQGGGPPAGGEVDAWNLTPPPPTDLTKYSKDAAGIWRDAAGVEAPLWARNKLEDEEKRKEAEEEGKTRASKTGTNWAEQMRRER